MLLNEPKKYNEKITWTGCLFVTKDKNELNYWTIVIAWENEQTGFGYIYVIARAGWNEAHPKSVNEKIIKRVLFDISQAPGLAFCVTTLNKKKSRSI